MYCLSSKVNILLTTKEPQPDAFEANNWTNNVQCTEHQQLQSQVLTALNTMNSTLCIALEDLFPKIPCEAHSRVGTGSNKL